VSKFSHYKAALYLCAVIALSDAIWVLLYVPRLAAKDTHWVFEQTLAAVITAVGSEVTSFVGSEASSWSSTWLCFFGL
jgi:hypothetical protein